MKIAERGALDRLELVVDADAPLVLRPAGLRRGKVRPIESCTHCITFNYAENLCCPCTCND